ncbi:MAG: DUF4199 domain-containing protein [Bacteroidales bacterium]|jgi:hypothetical protein|nr:DUF4199 domain-containing protein [Bacteroidales bacterium]
MALVKRYNSQMHGNYWRALLQYGFYGGLLLSFVVLLRYWLILPLSQPVTYVENIILLLLMIIFLWRYRSKLPQEKITFKEGYIVTVGLGVVASIVYGMFIYLYAWKIDPAISDRCFAIQRAIEANNMFSDDQVRVMTTKQSLALSAIMLSSILSVLWAMITALFLRTEKAEVMK